MIVASSSRAGMRAVFAAAILILPTVAGCERSSEHAPSSAAPVASAAQSGVNTIQGALYRNASSTWQDTSRFPDASPNQLRAVAEHPVSTFSLDVDTASYAVVRRFLREGRLPPPQAVRVEEMVNYFPYRYRGPSDGETPLRIAASVMPTPWNTETRLLHVAVKGWDIPRVTRPRINAVLLIDVSGSMAPRDRLPLLQETFRLAVNELRDDDSVAIVTYAGATGVALPPTAGRDRRRIIAAIDALGSGGSTAGAAGLQLAYEMAERNFDREAVNRVILATDGDFNVGITDPRALERFVAGKRKHGIYLSVFGVGLDNLNDALMQRLAQSGNGNAAYIDSALEGRKALVEAFASTMFPIADDVKAQIEFNPARVAAYRLIGYETRMLRREDFNDDRIDAGELGSGHVVTALYEIVPVGGRGQPVDPLRYAPAESRAAPTPTPSDELAYIKLRWKRPGESQSRLIERPVTDADERRAIESADEDLRFAAAVAAFAQRLRGEATLDGYGWLQIAALAASARGTDAEGYRSEFVQLVRLADDLSRRR